MVVIVPIMSSLCVLEPASLSALSQDMLTDVVCLSSPSKLFQLKMIKLCRPLYTEFIFRKYIQTCFEHLLVLFISFISLMKILKLSSKLLVLKVRMYVHCTYNDKYMYILDLAEKKWLYENKGKSLSSV